MAKWSKYTERLSQGSRIVKLLLIEKKRNYISSLFTMVGVFDKITFLPF